MILLARHGETADNRERRFQGQGPVGLNATGREQAQSLARTVLARPLLPVALYASPLARAQETAAVVGAALGLTPQPDARFAETDTGDWTGVLMDDVAREDPDGWAAYHRGGEEFRFPGGESLREQMDRVIDGLVDVTQARRLPALVVCHRGVIRVALCHTQNRGLDVFHDIEVPNGSVIEL